MPFNFTIQNATYPDIYKLFVQMQESILPLQVQSVTLSGTDSSMSLTVDAQTYFQPGKVFKIGQETINE